MNSALLIQLLTVAGLASIMLSMGLKVKIAELMASFRRAPFVISGIIVNFVLVPAVTVGLLRLFDPHPMISIGFLILAVCPGAPVGPPFASVAKGDVSAAVGLMVIMSCLSVVLSPALLQMAFGRFISAGEIQIDYLAIVGTLLIAQLLPLLIGLSIHHWLPVLTERIAKPIGFFANLLLLGVIVLVLIREFPTLALIRLRGWMGMVLLLAASLGLGWACGGPGNATRKSMALTAAARNAAVALVIVSKNFADTPAMTAVVAYSLFSILLSLGFAFLLARVSSPVAPSLIPSRRYSP